MKKCVLYVLNIGEFWQKPSDHLSGCGCKLCRESHLECEVKLFLLENNINFEYQKRFDWLGLQSLDFYLPEYNIAIECQGEQHFKPYKRFGGNEMFKKIQERDVRKLKLCNEHNINILYYSKVKDENCLDDLWKLRTQIYDKLNSIN